MKLVSQSRRLELQVRLALRQFAVLSITLAVRAVVGENMVW
jgi:hypothetical protein